MNRTYEKNSNGTWTEWSKDIFGNHTKRICGWVPREVRDCAEYYRVRKVEYDGCRARPIEQDKGWGIIEELVAAERAATEENARVAEERAHLEALRRARRGQYEAAVVGGALLGKLISDLVRGKK